MVMALPARKAVAPRIDSRSKRGGANESFAVGSRRWSAYAWLLPVDCGSRIPDSSAEQSKTAASPLNSGRFVPYC